MKKINDEEIKIRLNKENSYEIKTTSKDINLKFINEVDTEIKKTSSFNKKIFALIGAPLCVFSVIGVSLYFGLNNNPTNNNHISEYDEKITNEFLVFANFMNLNNSSSLLRYNKNKSFNDQNNINEDNFKKVIDIFDSKLENGLLNILNNNIKSNNKEGEFHIENLNFQYSTLIYKDNILISQIYYSNPINNIIEGVVDFNLDNKIDFNFLSKVENEIDETEKESIYYSKNSSTIYKIEEENEFEGREVENSYSFYEYNSKENLEDDNYLYGLEYEFENDEIECNYYIKEDEEYSFDNLKFISKDKNILSFEYNYELDKDDEEIEFEGKATLEYQENYKVYKDLSRNFEYKKPLN